MENDQEIVAQENDTETTENETEVAEQTTEDAESVEELKKRLATAEAQKDHWRKKANEKVGKEVVENKGNLSTLSTEDVVALSRVHEEDIERVEKFAKDEKISVKEALKNSELKAILDMRAENRTVANATNVSNTRRGGGSITPEALLSRASAGDIPEDDEGIQKLVAAKLSQSKNK